MQKNNPTIHLLLICLVVSWNLPMHRASAQAGAAGSVMEQSTRQSPLDDPANHPVAVVLDSAGTLSGNAVDNNGRPAAGAMVALAIGGKVIHRAKTDGEGRFAFEKLKPGDYQVATGQAAAFVRCYDRASAPPSAHEKLLISRDAMLARGQNPIRMLLHPLLVGVVIASAIAIPIAVSNNNDDDNDAS